MRAILIPATPLLALVLVATARAQEKYEYYSIDVRDSGALCVVDGEVRVVTRTNFTNWTLRETDKGWTVCSCAYGEIPARYLSVNAEGQVVLTVGAGEGSYWKFTRGEGRFSRFSATLQSKADMFTDWYLDFGGIPTPHKLEGFKSERFGPKLSKKPSAKPRLTLWLDGL